MEKIRYTKNELKRQKDNLKMFTRYLPTLMLKKQQLQLEIIKITAKIEDVEGRITVFKNDLNKWAGVFAENAPLEELIKVRKINLNTTNIAGIDIPAFESVEFDEAEYSFFDTPLWLDAGIKAVKAIVEMTVKIKTFQKQLEVIKEELRITNQRVNLFEKVKIPNTKDNIRRIRIFLGDVQTAAVVTGKIAKRKIQEAVR